ncbi:hypothetical protein K3722_11885 [Leisingera caerulea]|uniref:Uncharacterized protein n=1 Tax=Leisingera caerulea TaxID=506591 RepID=A0ABY5WSD4_LEICA|nr:hypothetical protein [Leisingera caerulea]UWQ57231.1 hypothetical protein K3722_11885 [Leisingera caerulea]
MLCKDFLRITCLGAAIALGLLVQNAQHISAPQADSWAGQAEGARPVQSETVSLAQPAAFNV